MRKLIPSLIALALCAPIAPAGAEDLLQIYDLAVVNDPAIRAAEQQLFATREVEPQARALLLPNLSAGATATQNWARAKTRYLGWSDDDYLDRQLSATVTQPVYNRGLWMSLEKTSDTISEADANYKNQQIALMVDTTERYFDVLRAADAVTVQESFVAANERQLEQSKQRFEVGLVAITDVNESQAAYDRSRASLITAKTELDNAWEALRVIVGPIHVPLARLGDKLPLTPPQPNDIDAWSETALRNNYGIVAATAAAAAAKKEIEVQRSGFYPTVGVEAGYALYDSDQRVGTVESDGGYVALGVNIPIYQGGAVASATRQAGYLFRAAQDQLDQTRRDVDKQVKDAFRGIQSSIEDVKARQAAIVSARSALESTQAGLEVGTRTQVDVLNAQRNLFEAEFEYLSARYTYLINGVKLHQATSTLTRDVLAKGNAWLNPADTVPPPAY